jgi:hypothetical protein
LCGKYTHPGSPDQDPGQPLYDGDQLNWVKEEMDLSNYIGQNIKLRFRLKSDGFVNEDGFYFDDLSVNTISASTSVRSTFASNYNQFSVYPNPAKDVLTIETNYPESHLDIYNATGKLILSQKIVKGKVQFNINEWTEGVYLIKQTTGNGSVFTDKVVVSK